MRPHDDEIEPAVIVVVEERDTRSTTQALRLGESSGAVVVPKDCASRPGEDDIERPVVVVVANRNGARACPNPESRIPKPAHAVVVEQRIAAIFAGDEDVDAPVIIEVAERGVAASPRDPVRVRKERECPVEVIAIDGERAAADQQQVEIAIVIHVDE